jgi:hypothetical protein
MVQLGRRTSQRWGSQISLSLSLTGLPLKRDQLVAETATSSMTSAAFEPAVPAIKLLTSTGKCTSLHGLQLMHQTPLLRVQQCALTHAHSVSSPSKTQQQLHYVTLLTTLDHSLPRCSNYEYVYKNPHLFPTLMAPRTKLAWNDALSLSRGDRLN